MKPRWKHTQWERDIAAEWSAEIAGHKNCDSYGNPCLCKQTWRDLRDLGFTKFGNCSWGCCKRVDGSV